MEPTKLPVPHGHIFNRYLHLEIKGTMRNGPSLTRFTRHVPFFSPGYINACMSTGEVSPI